MSNVDHFRLLGVMIHEKLTFKHHVDYVCQKLARLNFVMLSARQVFDQHSPIKVYTAYAQPLTSYGLIVYGSSFETNLTRIKRAHKRLLRTIFFCRIFDASTDLFQKSGIDDVCNGCEIFDFLKCGCLLTPYKFFKDWIFPGWPPQTIFFPAFWPPIVRETASSTARKLRRSNAKIYF